MIGYGAPKIYRCELGHIKNGVVVLGRSEPGSPMGFSMLFRDQFTTMVYHGLPVPIFTKKPIKSETS